MPNQIAKVPAAATRLGSGKRAMVRLTEAVQRRVEDLSGTAWRRVVWLGRGGVWFGYGRGGSYLDQGGLGRKRRLRREFWLWLRLRRGRRRSEPRPQAGPEARRRLRG